MFASWVRWAMSQIFVEKLQVLGSKMSSQLLLMEQLGGLEHVSFILARFWHMKSLDSLVGRFVVLVLPIDSTFFHLESSHDDRMFGRAPCVPAPYLKNERFWVADLTSFTCKTVSLVASSKYFIRFWSSFEFCTSTMNNHTSILNALHEALWFNCFLFEEIHTTFISQLPPAPLNLRQRFNPFCLVKQVTSTFQNT